MARHAAHGRPVAMVIDLTNSSRYYDPTAGGVHSHHVLKKPPPQNSSSVTFFKPFTNEKHVFLLQSSLTVTVEPTRAGMVGP